MRDNQERVQFDFAEDDMQRLNALCKRLGMTKKRIVEEALKYYSLLHDDEEGHIEVVDQQRNVVATIPVRVLK